ncbi:4850_t:CDS:2, partial [Racocetra persica]
ASFEYPSITVELSQDQSPIRSFLKPMEMNKMRKDARHQINKNSKENKVGTPTLFSEKKELVKEGFKTENRVGSPTLSSEKRCKAPNYKNITTGLNQPNINENTEPKEKDKRCTK